MKKNKNKIQKIENGLFTADNLVYSFARTRSSNAIVHDATNTGGGGGGMWPAFETRMEFQFRTQHKTGVIMSAVGADDDALLIQLNRGRIEV